MKQVLLVGIFLRACLTTLGTDSLKRALLESQRGADCEERKGMG